MPITATYLQSQESPINTMLAVIKDESAFSTGAVRSAGGVHSLGITPDGTVYGVAGHSLAMGQFFCLKKTVLRNICPP